MKETGIRRRDESEPVFEAGRRDKKSRTLTSPGANEPPHDLKFPESMQRSRPQAKLTLHDAAKNFQPSSPDYSSCITRALTHVEETCVIDFPSKKEVVDDASMDFVIGFVDEEEMFNMPALVNSMAEGMLLTPPAMKRGFRWSHDTDDEVDSDANYINLWAE